CPFQWWLFTAMGFLLFQKIPQHLGTLGQNFRHSPPSASPVLAPQHPACQPRVLRSPMQGPSPQAPHSTVCLNDIP
uniref:Uncharacterized protein n=1 Tax=Anas platyrhynchos platyrhynchos TaxID=8840 RepID=A0A493TKX2_ANAPP